MLVQGVEQLYQFVKKNGWNQISEVIEQPWGGKTCSVTTIDGSILTFSNKINVFIMEHVRFLGVLFSCLHTKSFWEPYCYKVAYKKTKEFYKC
jgi:hypothetical protein